MVQEQDLRSQQASPVSQRVSYSRTSPSSLVLPANSRARIAEHVIESNSKGLAGRHGRNSHHQIRTSNGFDITSTANAALSDEKILDCILRHLWDDLLVYGREARQAHLRNLTVVAKSWTEPVSQWLWMNPYFGTARRAAKLEDCLRRSPKRGLHIRKLIFGEGSSTDIMDWVTKHNVPNLLRAAPNVQVVGMGGLKNVHLDNFKDALRKSALLEEVRACDLMPEPWCYVDYLFDEVLSPCRMLSRLRLYNLYTNTAHARPVKQHFTQVAFNHCAINASGLHKIFASSTQSLKRLHIEYPMDLDGRELLRALRYVGAGLQELTVQGFSEQMEASDPPAAERLVDEILDACPNLVILNFPEAIGSKNLFDKLIGSKLELWSFSCNADVKPEDWLKALEHPDFPRPANCRVYATGWGASDVRRVRIQAYRAGVNWLLSGATLTELSEDHVN